MVFAERGGTFPSGVESPLLIHGPVRGRQAGCAVKGTEGEQNAELQQVRYERFHANGFFYV